MTIADRIRTRREELQLTQEELAKLVGYTSKTTITKIEHGKIDLPQSKIVAFANALQTTVGYLMGASHKSASALFVPEFFKVPIIGQIACGAPILAEESIEGYADVTEIKCDFALRCRGDSMAPALLDGDLVLIRQQPDVMDGQVAAVRIGNEATLKHLYHGKGSVTLTANNPAYPPIVVTPANADDVAVIGLAVGFLRKV